MSDLDDKIKKAHEEKLKADRRVDDLAESCKRLRAACIKIQGAVESGMKSTMIRSSRTDSEQLWLCEVLKRSGFVVKQMPSGDTYVSWAEGEVQS